MRPEYAPLFDPHIFSNAIYSGEYTHEDVAATKSSLYSLAPSWGIGQYYEAIRTRHE